MSPPTLPFGIKLIHCGNRNMVNPSDQGQKNIFYMPMGLPALARTLKEAGFDVEILHSDLDLEAGQTLEMLLDLDRLDAVGFDCHWINQSLVVMETAEYLKQLKPDLFIFLGGFSASLFAEEIVTHYPQVDAVIRGDAEIPILQLCQSLQRREPLHRVQNLVWRDSSGEIRENEFTYVANRQEMDRLDFAALECMRSAEDYKMLSRFWTSFSPIKESPLFLLEVGRGCQYACSFCGGNCRAQHQINRRQQTVTRSVPAILETVKKAVQQGFETFYTCLEFEGSQQWYQTLCQQIQALYPGLNFVYGSWKLPGQELIDTLSRGFQQVIIEISPETSDFNLRKKNKDPRLAYTNRQLEECLDYCRTKPNVNVQLYFGYYLAGDTVETILDTAAYIARLCKEYAGLVEAEFSNFSTDPGSLLFFSPESYHIDLGVRNFREYLETIKENYVVKKRRQADLLVFKPRDITGTEDAGIRRSIKLLNYLFSAFKGSISRILHRAPQPAFIKTLLTQTEIELSSDEPFIPGEIKRLLLLASIREGLVDKPLMDCLEQECEAAERPGLAARVAAHLCLDPHLAPQSPTQSPGTAPATGDNTAAPLLDYIQWRSGAAAKNPIDIDFNI